jgi:hypothetical protein
MDSESSLAYKWTTSEYISRRKREEMWGERIWGGREQYS